MQPKFVFRDKEGEKGGGGGAALEQQVAALMKAVGTLAAGMREMQQASTQQAQIIERLSQPASRKEDKPDLTDHNLDLDALDRKEFMALMMSRFQESLEGVVGNLKKEYDERLTNVSSALDTDIAKRELSGISDKHKDFYEWKDEIGKLLKETPSLSVGRAYTLARSENPEKAQKLDEKYNPPEPKVDFFGLTPTSYKKVEGEPAKDIKEAQTRAWDKVTQDMGIPENALPH